MLKFLTLLVVVGLYAVSAKADPPDCEGNVCTICHPDGECTIIIVNTPPMLNRQ